MTLCNCVLYLGIVFICTSAHACSLLVSVFLVHVLGLNGKSLSRVTPSDLFIDDISELHHGILFCAIA